MPQVHAPFLAGHSSRRRRERHGILAPEDRARGISTLSSDTPNSSHLPRHSPLPATSPIGGPTSADIAHHRALLEAYYNTPPSERRNPPPSFSFSDRASAPWTQRVDHPSPWTEPRTGTTSYPIHHREPQVEAAFASRAWPLSAGQALTASQIQPLSLAPLPPLSTMEYQVIQQRTYRNAQQEQQQQPPPAPEQQHRVYVLNCAHCSAFLTDRGMRVRFPRFTPAAEDSVR